MLETNAKALCFGAQVVGTKGEWQDCQTTSNRINMLSSDTFKMTAVCVDVRRDLQARIDTGCLTAAFVIKTSLSLDPVKVEREKMSVVKRCDRDGWANGNEWKDACLDGSDPHAMAARDCAVEAAVSECQEKGFARCRAQDAKVTFEYYFWGEPHCIAKATIVK